MKKIIKAFIALIMLILSFICFKYVCDMNMIPIKYLNMFLIIISSINLLATILLFIKGIVPKIFSGLFYSILCAISILGIKYSSNTIEYLDKGFSNNKEVTIYNVFTLVDSGYDEIENLNNTTMGYFKINMYDDEYLSHIDEKINVKFEFYDIYELYQKLIDKEIDSFVINEAYVDVLEEYFGINSMKKIQMIYNFQVERKQEEVEEYNSLRPINIYLSGSDSRSGQISSCSRSDVNMIITLNPITHTVLLTNIPRDYYVQLHGTTGYEDKLTHAGIYGVNMSKMTLEDLFDIKIDYTVKIGFYSVIEIVDLIGGVDIYSDLEFITKNGSRKDGITIRVSVKKGMNHFNGHEALAYSRERYSYADGDRHRGRNQQQVLEAIFTKIVSDKSLLFKYDSLLKSFSSLYLTSIPKEAFTMLVKEQLDTMPSWKVISQSVDGEDSDGFTYSIPKVKTYVMRPYTDSVNQASAKIKEISKF